MTETALAVIDQSRIMAVYDRMEPLVFIETMGKSFAMSGAGGCKTVADGQVMALACLCEGKTIFQIARRYHLMDGKLGLKSESMLADFKVAGGDHEWLKDGSDYKEASLKLVKDGKTVISSFTMEKALQAGYVKKGSNWEKRPDQQLRARCTTDGIRMGWPEIAGDYSVEELEDGFQDSPKTTRSTQSTSSVAAAKTVEPKPAVVVVKSAATESPVKAATVPAETIVDVEPEKPEAKPDAKTEAVPFDVGNSSADPAKGDADESSLPTAADSTFTAAVLEIQLLASKCGWTDDFIVSQFNGKWETHHTDLGQFEKEHQDFILANLRKVCAANEAELAAK